jgi:branched-chain amino acid aminotransferase
VTPSSPSPLVWVDGAFVESPATTPVITALDDAVLAGVGVFETIALRGGDAFHRRRHLDRLRSSARIVGVALDLALVDAGIDAVRSRWGAQTGRLRVTVTGGGAVIVSASVAPLVDEVATVVTAPWPRNERSPLVGAKTTAGLDNTLAFAHARSRGATESLFLNTRHEVCEGSRTNVFAVCDGRLVTPPLSAGCLPGVTRALVLEHGGAVEATVTPDELRAASEAFLTSALRGAQPIATIDGAPIGTGTRPHTQRVARMIAALSADA